MTIEMNPRAVRPVVCVGMTTAGKSKISGLIADQVGCDVIDIDDCITEHYGMRTIQQVIKHLGRTQFIRAEGRITRQTIMNLRRPTIVATGGSVVYSKAATQFLHREAHVIHFRITLETTKRRVARRANDNVVYRKGETLEDLYARRMPLYERIAHRTIDTDHGRVKIAERLARELVQEGLL